MTEIKKGPAAQTTEPTGTDDEGNGSTASEATQPWRDTFSLADVIWHRRYRSMPEASQALYLDLIQRADAFGCVSTDQVRAARDMRHQGEPALDGLIGSNLLTVEHGVPGFVLVLPRTLDEEEEAIFRGLPVTDVYSPFAEHRVDRSGR